MSDAPPASMRIPDDVKASISDELHRQDELDGAVPDDGPRPFCTLGAKHLRNHLPAPANERLTAWRRNPSPWLVVTNLPHPRHTIPTPLDGFGDEAALTVPNLVHFGMLELLGLLPVAYRWENEGRLVRNVAPRPESGRSLTSWGFSEPLHWHTDDSVLDHHAEARTDHAIPHYLSFYGMRNDERVPTGLLALPQVLDGLADPVVHDLRRPEFTVVAPESYSRAADGRLMRRDAVPLLWTLSTGHDAVRYGPDRVVGDTARAAAALARFEERLGTLPGDQVLLERGDFLVFDNRRVLHRRVPFVPVGPGVARWLRRCYAQGL